MTSPTKIWRLLAHDRDAIEQLAKSLNLAPVVAQLLLNRGVAEPDAVRGFLNAPLKGLYLPDALPGAVEAAEHIHSAVQAGRRICIYGDYDVDGLTGTAILW